KNLPRMNMCMFGARAMRASITAMPMVQVNMTGRRPIRSAISDETIPPNILLNMKDEDVSSRRGEFSSSPNSSVMVIIVWFPVS
ncbi:hypothetical protein PENTCL1PPCAC_24929, partial [Pristionchus entomophagus]